MALVRKIAQGTAAGAAAGFAITALGQLLRHSRAHTDLEAVTRSYPFIAHQVISNHVASVYEQKESATFQKLISCLQDFYCHLHTDRVAESSRVVPSIVAHMKELSIQCAFEGDPEDMEEQLIRILHNACLDR